MMKSRVIFIFIISVLLGQCTFAQSNIDLKTLIQQPEEVAFKTLKTWGINPKPDEETPYYYYAFGTGFQMYVQDKKVYTIWIIFDSGSALLQVDSNIRSTTQIKQLISIYGTPDETGSGYSPDDKSPSGWVKWKLKELQLHCEFENGKIKMVTLMEPNWYPGK
jgi:hypothetical protein